MPAAACGTPPLLLQAAFRWRINCCSMLVAFVEGGVGHSNRWAIKAQSKNGCPSLVFRDLFPCCHSGFGFRFVEAHRWSGHF
jgi:hypothetical protein